MSCIISQIKINLIEDSIYCILIVCW